MLTTPASLFGTDGVRGIANADLTPGLTLALGRAFGTVLREQTPRPEVLLARDTRTSGTMLAAATIAGLCSAGVQVWDCGILTTPALCLLTRHQGKSGGVVISASHNPPEFNGIKLVEAGGGKLPPETEAAIESLALNEEAETPRPTGGEIGSLRLCPQPEAAYLQLLFDYLGEACSLTGLKVVLDCAFGAAYALAPEAFRRAGAEVQALNATPEGERINVGCGALHTGPLAEEVVARGADLGVAFDGDGDRAMFVDASGRELNGDHIKYLLAADLQEQGRLDPPVVVGTVMSNLGLELALRQLGIRLLRAAVGDRQVTQLMRKNEARLGGEQSGHLIFAETGVGDGLYTALRVCEVVTRTGSTLAKLAAPVQQVPQVLLGVRVRDKHSWEQSTRLQQAVRDWEAQLGDQGRILIRASGTEPIVRVMVEALEATAAHQAAEELAQVIVQDFGYGQLLGEEE